MNCYLISYDLGVPETSADYKIVIDHIKGYGTWAKPLKSLWLVKTNKTVAMVRDELQALTDSNDAILVVDVTNDHRGTARISSEVTNWMNTNM